MSVAHIDQLDAIQMPDGFGGTRPSTFRHPRVRCHALTAERADAEMSTDGSPHEAVGHLNRIELVDVSDAHEISSV